MAKTLIFYFFQSDDGIAALNRHYDADPRFDASGAPTNSEATLLNQIANDWVALLAHVKKLDDIDRNTADPALRAKVEGAGYSGLPFDASSIPPIYNRRYESYTQAVKLVNTVGIRNVYAAYFLGRWI